MNRQKIKKAFEEKYAGQYLFFDAMQFGKEKIEIKCIKCGIWRPTVITYSMKQIDDEEAIIDWDHYTIRDWDKTKDW